MKTFTVRRMRLFFVLNLLLGCLLLQQPAAASPFGKGVFGADVPYGSATSIAISLSGDVNMSLTPGVGTQSGSGSHTITVTSTDVVGYDLYIKASTSTSMVNGSDTIAASGNTSPGALATNSWGYNTTGSTTNFKGIALSDALIHTATGPYKDGDDTTVTYGALVDNSKTAGTYTVDVTYTAVGQS